MYLWLENVNSGGFEVCLREFLPFDGKHQDAVVVSEEKCPRNYSIDENEQTNKKTWLCHTSAARKPNYPIKVVSCLTCLMQSFLVKGNAVRNLTQLVL